MRAVPSVIVVEGKGLEHRLRRLPCLSKQDASQEIANVALQVCAVHLTAALQWCCSCCAVADMLTTLKKAVLSLPGASLSLGDPYGELLRFALAAPQAAMHITLASTDHSTSDVWQLCILPCTALMQDYVTS